MQEMNAFLRNSNEQIPNVLFNKANNPKISSFFTPKFEEENFNNITLRLRRQVAKCEGLIIKNC